MVQGGSTGEGPLVSIVTPTLNQAHFIEDTIRSVRAQTYPNVEHIVVDGGSTDGTLEILRRHERPGFVWHSESDRGMYDAIGKGFRAARGDVLAYLNSDDIYPPWAVEVALRTFEGNPGLDVVYGDGLAIDVHKGRQRLTLVPPFRAASLAFVGSLVQPAVFLRRRVVERHGAFDPDLRFAGDLDYWLRLGDGVRFGRADEVLAVERLHASALSSAWAEAMALEVRGIRNRFRRGRGPSAAVRWVVARAGAAFWRRRLWFRFIRAARGPRDPGGPWGRMLSEGELSASSWRIALAFVPRLGSPFAWGAITSGREWFGRQPPDA
jgi:glycosyltransferase involved in cell wall biosynthesis